MRRTIGNTSSQVSATGQLRVGARQAKNGRNGTYHCPTSTTNQRHAIPKALENCLTAIFSCLDYCTLETTSVTRGPTHCPIILFAAVSVAADTARPSCWQGPACARRAPSQMAPSPFPRYADELITATPFPEAIRPTANWTSRSRLDDRSPPSMTIDRPLTMIDHSVRLLLRAALVPKLPPA